MKNSKSPLRLRELSETEVRLCSNSDTQIRMNEIPVDATPFPHRAGNLFKIQYSVNWNDEDPKLEKDYVNHSRVMYNFMTNYVSKNPRGAFLNYRDLDIGAMAGTGKNAYRSGKVYGEKHFTRDN
ncbi:hypothetical protein E3N88_36928 [Mikania micrantha]|uniref:Berberine/berberine-like domain-containing protein n=1 Tax=Mikania micrantha TaxID=192012 RepID=A0A5N6M5N0_9ASTR|nr:hypothetical protein E3N88_36928 [Mikania micrantha]